MESEPRVPAAAGPLRRGPAAPLAEDSGGTVCFEPTPAAPPAAPPTPARTTADSGSTVCFEPAPAAEPPLPVPARTTADAGSTIYFEPTPQPGPPTDPNATFCHVPDTEVVGQPPANLNQTIGFEALGETPPAVPNTETATENVTGVEVPGYEVLAELGRGGMGVVYKARDRKLNRLVALKMVLAGAHAGAAGLARFRAEAAAVAQLHHPNVVQIYETGESGGRPYFALEYVAGGSLEDKLKEGSLSPRSSAKLLVTLALTMDAAHQRGIVHRDLKPGNVLLAPAGNLSTLSLSASLAPLSSASLVVDQWAESMVPKIADFGLAKRLDEDSSQTQSGAILGTPCYMAPEQAKGLVHELGPAADIYSLGVILYELLVGRPPFKANSPIDTIRQVIEQEPIPPRQLEPRVPFDLETICLKCLHKDPARRYGTARELADDLTRFLNNEPVHARPVSGWERAWKWARRRPAVVALAGVVLAAVAGFVGMIVWFNLSLASERDLARREERAAREREQAALEGQRLSRLQGEGQRLFDQARVAAGEADWPAARLHLSKLLALAGEEPALDELRTASRTLLERTESELRTARERQESRDRIAAFARLRDEAQFLGTLYTGMDLAANLKMTRETAERALAVYNLPPDGTDPPTDDPHLTPSQRQDIRDDCFLLLLILAEARAQAAPLATDDPAGDLRAALALLESARRFGPPSRAWHFRRARYLRRLGDDTAAVREDRAAADTAPANAFDHFLLADELYRRDDFDGATREFESVLRIKPGHFWAQYLSALCLLRQHRAAEARAQLNACLAQRTDYVWLYLLRGFAQGELGDFDAADADYQSALAVPLDDFSRYVLFVNRGVLRVRQGRIDDAIADLQVAVKLRPAEYQAYANLAQAYRRAEKRELAGEQLDKAVALEPELPHPYRLRARLWVERRQPEKALADFEAALQREPEDGAAWSEDQIERGRTLLLMDRPADAVAAFDAALTAKADQPTALRLKADALFRLGRYRESVAAFDRYVLAGPPLESVYRGRGLARVELGQYPGAIEDFTKAVELKPTAEVFVQRGFAHLACDAVKLAGRDFQLALDLDPKFADAYLGRAALASAQKRPADAVREAEQALRVGDPTPRILFGVARVHALARTDAGDSRALELLRSALEALPATQRRGFVVRYIDRDAALAPLRQQPRFEQLLRQVSAGGPR